METVEIKSLARYFVKNILMFVIIFFVGIMISVLYLKVTYIPKYKSSTTILLIDTYGEKNLDRNLLTRDLTNACTRIIKGSNLLSKVIENLNLDYEVDDISKNINVESVNKAELIKIQFSDKNADIALKITNAISEEFVKNMQEIYDFQNIKVIDEAQLDDTSSSFLNIKDLLKSSLICFTISLLIVILKYYFDSSLKSIYDIKNLGYNVLGVLSKKTSNDKLNVIKTILSHNNVNNKVLFLNLNSDNNIPFEIFSQFDSAKMFNFSTNTNGNNNSQIINCDLNFDLKKLKSLVTKECKKNDIVILNTSDISLSLNLSQLVDRVIVVITLYKTSIKDLQEIKDNYKQIGVNDFDIIVDDQKRGLKF